MQDQQNHKARLLPLPKAATTITRGSENTYLTYLGNLADPSALMDDYLHKAMLNASESLCFPLQRKNSEVSGEIQKGFLQVQLHGYKSSFSLPCTPLKFIEELLELIMWFYLTQNNLTKKAHIILTLKGINGQFSKQAILLK